MRRRSRTCRGASAPLICLAAALSVAAARPVAAQAPTHASPVEKGAPPSICSGCHGLAVLAHMRQGEEGWRSIVDYMALHGAYMTPSEHEAVVGWLVRNYGPAAAPEPSANARPQDRELDLVLKSCTSCHGLARVTQQARTPGEWGRVVGQMRAIGAPLSDGEAAQVVRYLSENYKLAHPPD